MIILVILVAPIIVLLSFLGIFIPLRFIYSKDHFKRCKLKHDGISGGFWHFVDTRANLLSFDELGSKPLRRSPNRKVWLNDEKRFLESQINDNQECVVGYIDYCKYTLAKVDLELSLS